MGPDPFDHVFVQPSNFDDSVRFYREALGWATKFEWGDETNPRGACLTSGQMTIVLAEDHPSSDNSKTHGINGTRPTPHLAVDDVDARYKAIAPTGRALFSPQQNHWGTRWFVAADPDGNLIAFEQRSDA